jgi:hypothetical protein
LGRFERDAGCQGLGVWPGLLEAELDDRFPIGSEDRAIW